MFERGVLRCLVASWRGGFIGAEVRGREGGASVVRSDVGGRGLR